MSRSPARLSSSALCLLGAILVAALATLSLSRAAATFQPLGFVAERAGAGWSVAEVESPSTGLAPGDQILLVGGGEIGSASEIGAALRTQEETELVVLRDGELAPVTYHRPPVDPDWAYLLLAAIGALYLLIGVYTALRAARREAVLFYLWCLGSAAVYLLTDSGVGDPAGRLLYLVEEVARALLPPLTLHLFLVFPQPFSQDPTQEGQATGGPAPESRRRLSPVPFLYLPAAVLLTLQASLIVGGGTAIAPTTVAGLLPLLDRLGLVHLVGFSAVALGVLVFRLGRHQEWQERRQLQWIAIGMAAGYTPFLLLYLVPFSFGVELPELLASLAVVPLALVPLTFAWAILRYRLWDFQVMVRDVASTGLTVVLAGGVFALVQLAIERGVPGELATLRDLLTFGSGAVIAGLLLPTRRRLGDVLERFQYGPASLARRRALGRLGRELLHERDLARLCDDLLESIVEGVEVERVNLYLAGGEPGLLVPVRPEPDAPGALALDQLGPDLWHEEVVGLSGARLPAARADGRSRLFAAGYRYLFPLAVPEGKVGVLAVSHRTGGTPLSSDDVELVTQLLGSAALAIENARLLDQLHHHLDEVSELQRFSQGIIESSPAGIAVLAESGRIASANEPFARLVGKSREALADLPVADVLPVEPLPEPGAGLLEVSYCDEAGDEHHLQLSVAAYHAGHDEHRRGLKVLLVHDVSERVAMERALREKDRLAALGMLAAGVAHEVNTPITGISSYAQMLLADTPEDDPRHEILRKVERQTFRASRIVNNLLDFARNRDTESHPLDLVPVVRETLDLLDERRNRRNVALVLDLPEEPLVVTGSDGEIQQVLTNLAMNALDAMTDGGTLTVAAHAAGDRAVLTVSDTGSGIAPEKVDKIFQPFFSTKLQRGGTGLGLPISHDIVRRHGGEIRVESASDEGTRFHVELPLHRPSPQDHEVSTQLPTHE